MRQVAGRQTAEAVGDGEDAAVRVLRDNRGGILVDRLAPRAPFGKDTGLAAGDRQDLRLLHVGFQVQLRLHACEFHSRFSRYSRSWPAVRNFFRIRPCFRPQQISLISGGCLL